MATTTDIGEKSIMIVKDCGIFVANSVLFLGNDGHRGGVLIELEIFGLSVRWCFSRNHFHDKSHHVTVTLPLISMFFDFFDLQ